MNPTPLVVLSRHAKKRMSQRGITNHHIALAIRYGQRSHTKGAVRYWLREKDLPPEERRSQNGRHSPWVAILINPNNNEVITVYRTHSAAKVLR